MKNPDAASSPARRLFDAADALYSNVAYAQTLGAMLFDLIAEDDDAFAADGPASRDQRMYATVEALRARLDAIEKVESQLRGMVPEVRDSKGLRAS